MPNYNSTLQSNNTDLQAILNTINELPEAGGSDPVLQDKTITPTTSKQTVTADSGYDGLDTVIVNAMPTATQATPSITINANGLITATATQTAGYVAAGTKSSTHQLAFQAAKTIAPSTTSQIAVSSGYYTGGNITVAAVPTQSKTITPTSTTQNITPDSGKFLSKVTINGDSDLVAGNIKSGVSIFGVNGTYAGSGGGDTSVEDSLVTGTITTYTNDRVTTIHTNAFAYCSGLNSVSFPIATTIGNSAFYYCSGLKSVNFPAATTIGNNAFYYCSGLKSVNFPAATTIGNNAFDYCSGLKSVNFPAATTIGNSAFHYCSGLTSASFPAATTIGEGAFYDCWNLTSVSFPKVEIIDNYYTFANCSRLKSVNFPMASEIGAEAFMYCTSLKSANFPVATVIGGAAFFYCSSLTTVSFPKVELIGNGAFNGCSCLTTVSFPKATLIYSNAFIRCSSLTKIYLMGSVLCVLSKSNAFSETGIWTNKGSIFVPTSLVASYKAATNWAYFSNRIYGM